LGYQKQKDEENPVVPIQTNSTS